MSTVSPEKVLWLWPGRIPLGKLTVLDGDPKLGKSTVMLQLHRFKKSCDWRD